DVPKGHPEHYQDLAASIAAETEGGYFVNQFGNRDNADAHEQGTGPEILRQMEEVGGVDAVVVGSGSSGTVTGLSRCFAEHAPDVEQILADPEGSSLAEFATRGTTEGPAGGWLVEGIGESSKPPVISDFSRVARAYSSPDQESFLTARELLSREG